MEKSQVNVFGEFLVDNGYVTRKQLETAIAERAAEGNKRKLGAVIVSLNFLRRNELIQALNEFNPELLSKEGYIETKFPQDLLVSLKAAPMGESDDVIFFGTFHEDPEFVRRELSNYTKKQIDFRPAGANEILSMIFAERKAKEFVDEGNVYKLKEYILAEAMDSGATDIHIESGEETVHIRFRIDGVLILFRTLNKMLERPLMATIKNDSNMDASESRQSQDGSFSRVHKGRFIDFRVAVVPTVFGEKVTIRILDKEKGLLPLETLGLAHQDIYRRIIKNAEGIILIVGATGSGKSTTLYSSLLEMDRLGKAIYTVEEPVEYRLPFINQIQVNRKVGLDFAATTRALMRHDPDIIIVGEVRDQETAEQAIHASKTGHLVFITLHAKSVREAAGRLRDLGVNETDLAYTLKGIVAQKLIRKTCSSCMGVGCEVCFMTGYKGRTMISEVVQIRTPEDFKLLLSNQLEYETMQDNAKEKLMEGVTTHEEIERVLGEIIDV